MQRPTTHQTHMTQDCRPISSTATGPGGGPIAILSYHQTRSTPRRGVPVRTLVMPPWRFSLQLRALKALGWTGLSLRDLEPYLRGEARGKVFGISLDDGYLNNFEHALPVLSAVGFTATAYIVTGQIGGSNVWDHAKGVPPAPLMDIAHLKAWHAAGMELGAHTRTHVALTTCSNAQARAEIAGSKHDLEQALGIEVRSFSYPYGEHRPDHADMVRQAGFTTATTIVKRRARLDDDLLRLPRVSIHLENSLPRVVAQVATSYEDRVFERARRRGLAAQPAQSSMPPSGATTSALGGGVPSP
ncbi:MAG: polysaccharide deacetylase family protein [Ramlibacter sp.]